MKEELTAFLDKALSVAKSSRAWGVVGSNIVAGLSDLPPWPKALVLCVTVAAYIGSETFLKLKGKQPPGG